MLRGATRIAQRITRQTAARARLSSRPYHQWKQYDTRKHRVIKFGLVVGIPLSIIYLRKKKKKPVLRLEEESVQVTKEAPLFVGKKPKVEPSKKRNPSNLVAMVGMDGSQNAVNAFREALLSVRADARYGDVLYAVTIVPHSTASKKELGGMKAVGKWHKELSHWMKEEGKEHGIEVECIVKEVPFQNDIREGLCETAKELGVHKLFVGSRGLGPVVGMLLGTVSMHAVRNCECNIEVVRGESKGGPSQFRIPKHYWKGHAGAKE